MSTDSPSVESFVLRFVQDPPSEGADSILSHDLASVDSLTDASGKNRRVRATWHAVVVHVQTNEEKTFTNFADAVAFISRYVPLGEFHFKTEDGGAKTDAEHSRHPSSVIGHSGE